MRKIFIFFLLISGLAKGQDSLPAFSVVNKGNNRAVISWNNKYPQLKQISIQRSADSLTNFKTIATVPDPNNRQNGFLDSKAPFENMFYRLYILVDGSNFVFSKSKRPTSDSIRTALMSDITNKAITDSNYIKVVEKIINENLPDSALTADELALLRKYRNSKADLFSDSVSRKIDSYIKANNKPKVVIPAYHVDANSTGIVKIQLKDFKEKKYTIRFFEDDDTFLFEIKEIKDASLLLEKSNFYHSGWFKSELYDDGKLVEKSRFFIPKDF